LLVRFRAGASQPSRDIVLASHGVRRKRQLRGESGVEKLEVLGGQNPETVAQLLSLQPEVELAEPNFLIAKDQLATSDPQFPDQWALRNTGQSGGQFGSDINVTTAWQTTTGSQSSVIGVIDSGIDFTHPDLIDNEWTNDNPGAEADVHGWDYITDSNVIRDEQGHGTAIAGIIAAAGNNATGITGVMWQASLMSLRVLDNTGTGDISNAVEAIDYAVSHGAQVINLSWGTTGNSQILKDAIERAMRRGVVVVCSAGNNGQDVDSTPYYPASFGSRDLLAVASTDNFDQLTAWSDYGRRNVTVAAPGNNILTTRMGGGYWNVTGTSASAPLVSGVVGLLKSVSPLLNTRSAAKAISDGARRVASLAGKVSSGGVVDAAATLRAVRGNPYQGNGGGNQGGGNNGNGGGNGQNNVPAALRPDTSGRRANGREGQRGQVPAAAQGAPGNNLPNLTQLRNLRPAAPHASQPIQSNLTCADCDPQSGGGGAQNFPAGDPNFSTARTLPQNETGQTAVDLGSRNFNWSQTLLSLAGRSGMDLNLSLFYNSLVWTKDGSYIKYNADRGTPAPGFRLGLPTLQQRHFNSQSGAFSYLMVTPSGGRVEMRETGIGVYESTDGGYTQLKENTTYYSIMARSGLSAAVAQSSTANGAQIVQWPNPWTNDPNFEWQLIPTDSGFYKLVNHNSGKVAVVASGSFSDGANVVLWDSLGASYEQWQIVPNGNGYYKLIARHSGKALQVGVGQGAYLQQWTSTGAASQQWQFAPLPSDTVTVRTSDGTQYTFTHVAVNNEYRCTQIKDRNGNFITATYDATNGHLLTITDTANRPITFAYDSNNNLQAIRRPWAGIARDWATFSYGEITVAPQFGGGLFVNGPTNNLVTVLTRVDLADGSSFRFDYNAAFGQVKQINHFAADDHLLAYTSYNVEASAGQTDCPRFTERRDWAQNWNGDDNGQAVASEEAVTTYAVATDNSWTKVTAPDGTVYKEYFATSGWQTGLTTSTKNYANATDETNNLPKKWTTMTWTQDDESLFYPRNPRVTESNIYDTEGNHKRVTINYGAYAAYSLPYEVTEYAADGTTIVRRTVTDYNLSSAYLDRRIIGLVSAVNVFDQANGASVSKTTFEYDWGGEYLAAMPQAATQHDAPNYGSSFVTGRGNLSAVWRWDVTDINNAAKAIQQQRIGYDVAGCAVFARDALGHQTSVSYADSFSDGDNTRNTFAFPTTFTDAEGYQSLAKYNFDYGAVTWRKTPAPNAGQAPTTSFTYDSIGRIKRVTNDLNQAFTEFVYPNSMTEVNQFTTIDPNSITNSALRAFVTTLLDGAGRTRATAADHPGSSGGLTGQYFIYNNLGQLVQQSNPTEINDQWLASGDDAYNAQTGQGGWRYSIQAYDWKGRPTITTNTDGTQRTASYGGCGCAGGEVTTVQDEHGRRRRLTKDNLGRLWKVEELNWNATVYATTLYTYNVRDQLTQSNQANQLRSFAYDGYGRLQTRTTPEQGATNYNYNADDTTNFVTDARGAKTIFGYNPRHLVVSISYDLSNLVPGQSVAPTSNVSFTYDAAGNRQTMSDGMGSVSYSYDNLSQLTSETRGFNETGGAYTLAYSYNLAGELTSIIDYDSNTTVNYGYDKAGRVTGVTGEVNYATGLTYRAFGAIKGMNYGDGKSLSTAYDNRMRPTKWDVSNVLGYNYNYDYLNEHTGRVTYAGSIYDATLDRSYEYDNVGRLAISHSGAEARAHAINGQWGTMDGPYSQGYDYDVWGNVTHKYGWGGEVQGGTAGQTSDIYYNYTNNNNDTNNQRNGFSYDAAGNLTNDIGQQFTYDATGQQTASTYTNLQNWYDGDGLRIKKRDTSTLTYYLRSTVLGGQVVKEIMDGGDSQRSYTYLGGALLAVRDPNEKTYWVHEDPITKSKRVTNSAGTVVSTVELDPWGADTNRSNNAAFQPKKFTSYERDANGSDEAMFRRSNRWHSRFDQPDPYDGSYLLTNPQSLNRYAYVQNDPVNFVDLTGLEESWNYCPPMFGSCAGSGGGGYTGNPFDSGSYAMGGYNDLPGRTGAGLRLYDERVGNAWAGYGFLTNEEVFGSDSAHAVICLDGECWDAGTEVYPRFSPFGFFGSGTLDQWPPANPYNDPFGWKTPAGRGPGGLEQFPDEVHIGPKGVEHGPNFNPNSVPSNASRSTRILRAGISAIKAIGNLIGSAGSAFIDVIGPISGDAFHAHICNQHPSDPGCGGSGGVY